MRCTLDDSSDLDKKEIIDLYVTTTSFVLIRDKDILEIPFNHEEKKMARLNSFESTDREIIQKYEIYGIIGFIEGFQEKYMVVISSVQCRGSIMGSPIYMIDEVNCLSFDTNKACQRLNAKNDGSERDETSEKSVSPPPPVQLTKSNSFLTRIKKTLSKKRSFNRDINNKLDEDTLIDAQEVLLNDNKGQEIIVPSASSAISQDSSLSVSSFEDEEEIALNQRVVKQVTELFSRSMFLYSNTCDITNSFQRSYEERNDYPNVPLWKTVDKRFWWNEYLIRDFITQELDEWIVPIMQGTLQIEPCQIEGYHFDFILLSRRSKERAGMRYQRRGVNEDGQVANFVETEQILIFKKDDVNHVASFIQTRGSIPVFWSQSPYSLHPIPILERSKEENELAFKKHFATQERLYGKQLIVNLTELMGREAIVGGQYRKHIVELGDPNIKYVEFDFHKETKGMKFENISKLSKSLHDDLSRIQYFWETNVQENNEPIVYCKQTGVFRTNCMDCLDRTNVVQSSFGRSVLNLQLMRFGISEYPEQGIKYYDGFERIFNNVWANNGDMISRMYAGTSALKGDFTRTGKRNITGMMNDASNSLARMYFNTIKDFWRQATVDFILGYHKAEIFRHVPQSTKMSAEPGFERRWAKIRLDAINISSEIVIAEDETKIGGWTLLSPSTESGKQSKSPRKHFEEKVVLLTEKALYVCSYNYELEKVIQFKRLPFDIIASIQIGEYILSSLTPASRSEDLNYGFIVYHSKEGELVRWNTGSIHNQSLGDINISNEEEQKGEKEESTEEDDLENQHVATSSAERSMELKGENCIIFKAVRYNVLGELDGEVETCKEQIQDIVKSIVKACKHEEDEANFIRKEAIISLKQAEKTDGIFRKMGYKIKQAIWI
ncbi:MAG: SacI homology domain-containing protein [Benjaminiella poitrasii]|nr:MAG: SacI homology domain-containing protein [Benjaminiella poitrasii]